ncbi:MAG: hypothetical protein HY332_22425 [Chloroflexi bacterium]|nr:hypothetical protein [Chloroflexota bacterium]
MHRGAEVHERYQLTDPCVVFVHKWVEDRFFDEAAAEPRLRNVLYVCASEAQIARAGSHGGAADPSSCRDRLLPSAPRVRTIVCYRCRAVTWMLGQRR